MSKPDPGDVEARLSTLEREVAQLRSQLQQEVPLARTDADAARQLAAGADRDVSEVRAELRAHTQSLNALRETQIETRTELAQTRAELAAFANETRSSFATVNAGIAHITTLIESIATDTDSD